MPLPLIRAMSSLAACVAGPISAWWSVTPAFTLNRQGMPGRRVIVSALLSAWLMAGCASPPPAGPPADHPKEKAQVERRLQEVFAASEDKDFDRLDRFHLYGPKFTKFTESSPERLDAAAGREGEHRGLGSLKSLKLRADALKIDVFGQVAVATFMLESRFDAGGASHCRTNRSTLVFVKEGGEWKIAHEHFSLVKP